MSDTATAKTAWLARIERARATWEELVAAAARVGFERPGAAGAWTFKDVAAHLNGWRERTVARMEAAASGAESVAMPWPTGMDGETDAGTEEINRWFYERGRGRSIEEILAEATEQYQRILAATRAVAEPDLLTPGRYPWLGNYALCEVIAGSNEHLYVEHEPAIRHWLETAATS